MISSKRFTSFQLSKMVIDNHDCSCGSGCSRVGQFHQHAQPNWVDHCSCMPRGSGDLLHRQQADFLNIPRSSAAVLHSNSPVLQDPFVSPSSTCFLHAAPLRRCAPRRCAAALRRRCTLSGYLARDAGFLFCGAERPLVLFPRAISYTGLQTRFSPRKS